MFLDGQWTRLSEDVSFDYDEEHPMHRGDSPPPTSISRSSRSTPTVRDLHGVTEEHHGRW